MSGFGMPFQYRTNMSGFGMASLDRFINKGHKKYFIHAKTVQFWTIRKPDIFVRYWNAIRKPDIFVRIQNGPKLDRFIKKRVIKNILFMPKRSSFGPFENRTNSSGFRMVRLWDARFQLKSTIRNLDSSGFRIPTVTPIFLSKNERRSIISKNYQP